VNTSNPKIGADISASEKLSQPASLPSLEVAPHPLLSQNQKWIQSLQSPDNFG
jgi:hypothetical protein